MESDTICSKIISTALDISPTVILVALTPSITLPARAITSIVITSNQYIRPNHNTTNHFRFHQQQPYARARITRLKSDNTNILSPNRCFKRQDVLLQKQENQGLARVKNEHYKNIVSYKYTAPF